MTPPAAPGAGRARVVPVVLLTGVVAALVALRSNRRDVVPPRAPVIADVVPRGDPVAPATMRGTLPETNLAPDSPAGMLHGDPSRRHRARGRGPAFPNVAWTYVADGPLATQVVVSKDASTLYLGTLSGKLVALDVSGTPRWTVDLGDRVYSAPYVHPDGTLYVGSDAKRLFAVSTKGAVLWKLETGSDVDTSAAPTPEGTIVFASGRDLFAVRRTGDVAWRARVRGKIFTSAVVREDGVVVVGAQDHRVHAFSKSGTNLWSTDLGADVDGAPVLLGGGAVAVGTDASEVVRLQADGAIAWRTNVGGFVRGPLSCARNGDVLAGVYGPSPRMVRIEPSRGAKVGEFLVPGTGAKEFGVHGGALEDDDGTLYFGAQDDLVRAVAIDGTLRWTFPTRGDVDAPLTLLDDGTLLVPSEDGTLTALRTPRANP
ncbi:MAG: PQQ-binding-like beta-propeller repeat protein [Polyangiaceae bacterium]